MLVRRNESRGVNEIIPFSRVTTSKLLPTLFLVVPGLKPLRPRYPHQDSPHIRFIVSLKYQR